MLYKVHLSTIRVLEQGRVADIMEWLVEHVGHNVSYDIDHERYSAPTTDRYWAIRVPFGWDGGYNDDRVSDDFLFRFSHYQDLIHFKLRWF